MIKNMQQLAVAERKIEAARAAADATDSEIERVSLTALADDMQVEVNEYQAITSGQLNLFLISSIDDLADGLIRSRIARGWTQQRLADELGVTQQMVQRDEDGGYEKANFARIAEVADVLGYTLTGELRPTHLPDTEWRRQHVAAFGGNRITFVDTTMLSGLGAMANFYPPIGTVYANMLTRQTSTAAGALPEPLRLEPEHTSSR